MTEEARRALDHHIVLSMLDAMDDPEFVEEIASHREGFDADQVRARLERDVEITREALLGRPQGVELVAQEVLA